MTDDFHALYFDTTVNTWHEHVRTDSLMLLNVFPDALLFALGKGLALCRRKLADRIVVLNLFVRQNLLAAETLIIAHKLHVL